MNPVEIVLKTLLEGKKRTLVLIVIFILGSLFLFIILSACNFTNPIPSYGNLESVLGSRELPDLILLAIISFLIVIALLCGYEKYRLNKEQKLEKIAKEEKRKQFEERQTQIKKEQLEQNRKMFGRDSFWDRRG